MKLIIEDFGLDEINSGTAPEPAAATPATTAPQGANGHNGDTILLAGKGHERSMLTAGGSEPWDERAEAEAAIRERTA